MTSIDRVEVSFDLSSNRSLLRSSSSSSFHFIRTRISTMIIPRFSLSQTSTHLSIRIRCPYVKFSSSNDENSNGVEVDLLAGNEFYFACKPYYLHLYLPGRVIDQDPLDYHYDVETSSFCFNYQKETANEHFENLDMLTHLLHRDEKKTKLKANGIEEIDAQDNGDVDEDEDEPLWNQMRQLEINGSFRSIVVDSSRFSSSV